VVLTMAAHPVAIVTPKPFAPLLAQNAMIAIIPEMAAVKAAEAITKLP